jgi:uncharacterized protein YabN with tetrapyrrole methylase and pyrophosphatase domain
LSSYRISDIFLEENIKTIDKVIDKWENVKRQEKQALSHSEILQSIPKALPSLTRSRKIQSKAANVGFGHMRAEDALREVRAKKDAETLRSLSGRRSIARKELSKNKRSSPSANPLSG